MHKLQIVFKEISPERLRISVSLTVSYISTLFHTRYLSCDLDLNTLCRVEGHVRGTCIIFGRDDPSQQHPESVLRQDNELGAITTCRVVDDNSKHVWTGRPKRKTSTNKTTKTEIMFWHTAAVGYC